MRIFISGPLSRAPTSVERRGFEPRPTSSGCLERTSVEAVEPFEQQGDPDQVDQVPPVAKSFAWLEEVERHHDEG